MTTQTPTAARTYLARVRTALADLPPAEIEEIVEDVRPQLVEITEEAGEDVRLETLIERLGTPESYAAELRAAGDYPPPSAEEKPAAAKSAGRVVPRLALWGFVAGILVVALFGFGAGSTLRAEVLLGALLGLAVIAASGRYVHKHGLDQVNSLPEVRSLRNLLSSAREGRGGEAFGYLGSLRPAWWLLCGVTLLLFGLAIVMREASWLVLFPVFLIAAAAIVWAGPRSSSDRRLRWVTLPLSALVVGGGLGMAGYVLDRVENNYSYNSYNASGRSGSGTQELMYGNESVDNVYAFDAEGKPLTEFYLYDEQGRPIAIPRYACEPETGEESRQGTDNRFPRPRIVQGAYDDQGRYNGYNAYRASCTTTDGVPFTAAIPKQQPAPAPPAPAPTGTTTSAPGAPAQTTTAPPPGG
ncbi:hypothetical protein CFN78_07420 [Amycolatopsis antarctica]|uniref:Uncharacterized protein n=1 Tax=Amycolatopsis antarctica TaxID=1854586 RepID=A0A263D7V9_9PSEU|nr:hypothetical protein [Amycolatopsis antarctica]OZM74088.1 hypothetical protein CFN78_07420 [Amycolatopsis antarctica]